MRAKALRVAKHHLEQLAEELVHTGIFWRIGRCPGGRHRHHLVVATVDSEEIELAGHPRLESCLALTNPVAIQIICGIRHQHQPVVRPRFIEWLLVGEGKGWPRLRDLHHGKKPLRGLVDSNGYANLSVGVVNGNL